MIETRNKTHTHIFHIVGAKGKLPLGPLKVPENELTKGRSIGEKDLHIYLTCVSSPPGTAGEWLPNNPVKSRGLCIPFCTDIDGGMREMCNLEG